jgi:hypothetical protein
MKTLMFAGVALLFLVGDVRAQFPELPPPTKEHDWLKQFVGEWESRAEVTMAPGQPPITAKGGETNRMLGGFWMVSEGSSEIMGTHVRAILTIGYDPDKKRYVGTWVDSMTNYLWKYEGTVDATGKVLILETEGPSPTDPSKTAKFREVHEFKSADYRSFTSSVLGTDGKWVTFVKVDTRRKK